jgi:acyl carrier protein
MISDQIRAIWSSELKRDDFSDDDDFFDLGGHSLIMGRIQAQIHAQLGTGIPMDELMRHSTVKLITAYLQTPAMVASHPDTTRPPTPAT